MRADFRNPTTVVRRIILPAVVLLAANVAGRAIYLEAYKSRLYAAGRAALGSMGRRLGAFAGKFRSAQSPAYWLLSGGRKPIR